MYDIIMAPTDGSGLDREAIRVATRLSDTPGAQLKLVRVYSAPMVFSGPDTLEYPHEAIELERKSETATLKSLTEECGARTRAAVTYSLADGPIAPELARYAKENKVDLIVISSHCRGGIVRAALGSVTDSLIRETNLPVLVVKGTTNEELDRVERPFRRILVPLDGSRLAEQILPHAVALARRDNAAIVLHHVLVPLTHSPRQTGRDRLPSWENEIERAQSYLGEQAEMIRRVGVPATIELSIEESPAECIARTAARLRADIIAIATHGRGGIARLVRGSVADKLLRTSRGSLLVLRPFKTAVVDAPTESRGVPLAWSA